MYEIFEEMTVLEGLVVLLQHGLREPAFGPEDTHYNARLCFMTPEETGARGCLSLASYEAMLMQTSQTRHPGWKAPAIKFAILQWQRVEEEDDSSRFMDDFCTF